jgi:hypothetical protein
MTTGERQAFDRWLGELEFPPAKLLEGESVKDDPAIGLRRLGARKAFPM